jgi:hypothetical protein
MEDAFRASFSDFHCLETQWRMVTAMTPRAT